MPPMNEWQTRLMGKTLLIFDFDGTVADTSPLHAAAFTDVLAPLGVDVDYSSIAGMKTLDAIRAALAARQMEMGEERIASLVVAKQLAVRRLIAEGLHPLPGVDAFLRWARQSYRMAMVTSGSRATVELSLEKLGYSSLFDPLLCAEELGASKPAPDGFLKCLAVADVPAASALIFEDSEAGFASARAAGVDFEDARHFFNPREVE